MTIKALCPTVRPTLNLDFAKTKALDPRITFTRASTATFVGSNGLIQTAASGVPRFDHNPATGESLGLLMEEARTNLITYSQDFNSTNYSTGYDYGAFTTNAIAAPDGTVTASKLTRNAGTLGCWWGKYGIQTVSVVSGTAYTISCYLKAAEISAVRITGDVRETGGLNQEAIFTLSGNGSYTLVTGTSAQIVNVGNGWYRCSVTGTADATTTEEPSLRVLGAGNNGDGFYAWGFQLEVGAFPTSYIPTTTAAVTRAADLASMTGANFSSWYNQSQGTLIAAMPSGITLSSSSNQTYFGFSAGAVPASLGSGNGMRYGNGSPSWSTRFQVVISGIAQADSNNIITNASKIALAYATDNFAMVRSGSIVTDSSGNVPSGIDTFAILGTGSQSYSRLAYYPVRLSDTQLQTITTT